MHNKFNIAVTEVLYIIKYFFSTFAKSKIPDSFIKFLKENSISGYNPKFNRKSEIKDLPINEETKSLLALVYRDYLCTEEEKQEFNNILIKNNEEYQEELRKKYNSNNIFKKKQITRTNALPAKVKENSIFKRILEQIKKIFK